MKPESREQSYRLAFVTVSVLWCTLACTPPEGRFDPIDAVPDSQASAIEIPENWQVLLESRGPEAVVRSIAAGEDPDLEAAAREEIRVQATDRIAASKRFAVGDEVFEINDIHQLHEWFVLQPDRFHYRLLDARELEPRRLLFLAVANGKEHSEPAASGDYVMPEIDFSQVLDSTDPWVVSAALFMARKQGIALDLEQLAARWRDGGWDAVCTDQAIQYLAAHHAGETALFPELNELESATSGIVEIQPLPFYASGQWESKIDVLPIGEGLRLVTLDSTMEAIADRPVRMETIEMPATRNFYTFTYLNGQMHGESRFVDGSPDLFVRMAVAIKGGV